MSYCRHLVLLLGRSEQSVRRGADGHGGTRASLAGRDAAEASEEPSLDRLESSKNGGDEDGTG